MDDLLLVTDLQLAEDIHRKRTSKDRRVDHRDRLDGVGFDQAFDAVVDSALGDSDLAGDGRAGQACIPVEKSENETVERVKFG